MKHVNFNLSDDLHIKFKLACTPQGKKMTDVMVEFVEKYAEEFGVRFVEKKKSKQ